MEFLSREISVASNPQSPLIKLFFLPSRTVSDCFFEPSTSDPVKTTGGDFGVVVSSELVSEHDLRERKSAIQHSITDGVHFWASRLFPWSADNSEVKLKDITEARYVPWLGLSALVHAGMTIPLMERAHCYRWNDTEKERLPEACFVALSNSVRQPCSPPCRLSEGVTTAWWLTVSRSNGTVRDVHDTWSIGQSSQLSCFRGRD